jgi:hypothetical protein
MKPGQAFQESRLSNAGGTDDADNLAGIHGKSEVFDDCM